MTWRAPANKAVRAAYQREWLRQHPEVAAKKAANAKAWRQKNPDYSTRVSAKVRARWLEQKAKIDAIKRRPCVDCGVQYPPWVMEFDHRVQAEKKFAVGNGYRYAWSTILSEIEKCDLVCSNCHAERTHKTQAYKFRRLE